MPGEIIVESFHPNELRLFIGHIGHISKEDF